MTTAAIVVGSVFAYVVVAGRVYRWLSDRGTLRGYDMEPLLIFWPLTLVVMVVAASFRAAFNLGATPGRRSKLPEARVRR